MESLLRWVYRKMIARKKNQEQGNAESGLIGCFLGTRLGSENPTTGTNFCQTHAPSISPHLASAGHSMDNRLMGAGSQYTKV
jgi:hypothetical protein